MWQYEPWKHPPSVLPEHLLGLPAIEMQFIPEILTRFYLGYFTVRAAVLRFSAYRECKRDSALL